jgi:hypothetical protein
VVAIRGWKLEHFTGAPQFVVGVTEPIATEPTATEPTATEPTVIEPTATEPTATEPTATEPTATAPTATAPTATAPTATAPTATAPTDDDLIIEAEQVVFLQGDRRYRIRGLEKNTSTSRLLVSIMASRDSLVHLDSIDLIKARSRQSFIKAAATEMYVDEAIVKQDIAHLLLRLESLQAQRIAKLKSPTDRQVKLSEGQRAAALQYLQAPQLLERIVADVQRCGLAGQKYEIMVSYLATISRKLPTPLAVVVQSSSAAGKTSLMDAVLALVPKEDQLRLSSLSSQSLYYLEEDSLRHKVLAISEEGGLSETAYALKLLQSEGALHHATVTKGESGRLLTQQYSVSGPVQLFLTTTAVDLDEELMNRSLVLSIDESSAQTQAIQDRQRSLRTPAALLQHSDTSVIRDFHQNVQRCLEPLLVCNPFAEQLTFSSSRTRLRRDHAKYLTLIDTIALLHQHQRPIETLERDEQTIRYVQVTAHDIRLANRLAGYLLGRSLDELAPQSRSFLMSLESYVTQTAGDLHIPRNAVRFTRRDIRQAIGCSEFQSRTHLDKLLELEYVLAHRGKNGQRYVYELVYDGQGKDGRPFLLGLADPEKWSAA